MIQIISKFRYGLTVGAIALALILVAEFSSWDCQDDRARLGQPGTLAMQDMQNEMAMHMRQGMLSSHPVEMMPPPFSFGEKPLPPFLHGLDLSELQRDRIFELLHNREPVMRAQGKSIRKVMAEINQLAASDHYSAAEVRRLADKLAGAIADSVVLRTESDAGIHELLTPEQRKHMDDARARFEADFAHDEHPLP